MEACDLPKTLDEQKSKFTDEEYNYDLNTLFNIYKDHCPYKEKNFYYPEFNAKTDIVLPCESSIRTNLDVFTKCLQLLCPKGVATFRQNKELIKQIRDTINESGLINFLNEYVDTYISLMYKSIKQEELNEDLRVSIFINSYCASMLDAILCMHNEDTLSGLTAVNEAIKLQLNIVDSVCNVRKKEFNVVEAGIRWGIDTSYLA